ncbi:dioxygenase [Limnohabitans sp. B9-3]|uniref:dioxygenase family protein n=1 Tax=Limnohabitans sp. B9-3 TaxID=1100707 RepID=UPI001179CB37|nr:dioxygenase [Limnohabitans sp. B9-3]
MQTTSPAVSKTDALTSEVMQSFAHATDPRLAQVMGLLAKHLHAFVVESKLTKEEWLRGLTFLTASAAITSEERNEFSLFSDIMGISSMVDVVSQPEGGTPSSVLGPFHNHDSRLRANGSDLTEGQAGDRVWFHGRVVDADGQPIQNAQIDFWQNADNGLYPAQDPDQDPHNLRCKIACEANGSFNLLTIRPHPYTVPTDGPVGALLAASQRNIWRPAHYHVIVSASGYVGLVTELFPEGSAYLTEDTVFGVRPGLVVDFKPCHDAAVAQRFGIATPFLEMSFEFCLAKQG